MKLCDYIRDWESNEHETRYYVKQAESNDQAIQSNEEQVETNEQQTESKKQQSND